MAALIDPMRQENVNSFLRVVSEADLQAQERQQMADENDERARAQQVASSLANHIRACYSEAERHRQTTGVTDRLLDCQRRRKGVYGADILARIQQLGGNETFFNITKTKCKAAESWIHDTIAPVGEKPWSLEPTPIADLPQSVKDQVVEGAVIHFQMSGQRPTPEAVQQFTMALYDETMAALAAEAKKRTERMSKKIEDQLAECNFIKALHDFIHYYVTYPTAFLKGPIWRKQKRAAWDYETERLEIVEVLVPMFEAPSPHDILPAPNAKSVQDAYLLEWVNWNPVHLAAMRGEDGWNTEAINAVLEELSFGGSNMTHDWVSGEAERADLENRDMTVNNGIAPMTNRGLDFYGPAQVRALREWGMSETVLGPPDPVKDLDVRDIHAILIGRHVVFTALNPHPLGLRPYYESSAEKVPGSIWGESIPEQMKDCQDPLNACLRNMIDNLGLASGPQVSVDMHSASPGQDLTQLFPWKIWYFDGSKLPNGTRKPVDFFQPDARTDELLQTAEYFEQKADERTRIPRYAHGEANVGGAGDTASGLSMLMSAAAKGIKQMIAGLDLDILRGALQQLYLWNLMFEEDPNLKADAQIIPRGVLAMLVKEQVQLRRQEFLDRTANEFDMAIIGVKGRATVLRAVAAGLDLPADEIVPKDEDLMAMQQAAMAAQSAEAEQAQGEQGAQTEPPQPTRVPDARQKAPKE